MTKIYEDVKAALLNGLENLIGYENNTCTADLHNELYNSDARYVYYATAKEATAELDVWECIGVVQTYEKEQFGEVHTKLSDACKVANMIIYIMGYELLQSIYGNTVYFNEKWDEKLTVDDLKEMLAMAEKWFDENSDGLNEIWLNLPTE